MEGIGAGTAGEVIVRAGTQQGRIYIFSGKIAWVNSTTVHTRLRDVLARSAGIATRALEDAIRFTQESKKNFAETLVERGLVDPARLRSCLLEHNAEHFRGLMSFADVGQAMFIPQARQYRGNLLYLLEEVVNAAFSRSTDTRTVEVATTALPSETKRLLELVPDSTHAAFDDSGSKQVYCRRGETLECDAFWGALFPLLRPHNYYPGPEETEPSEVVVLDADNALLIVRRSGALTAALRCAEMRNFGLSLGLARKHLKELLERPAV